MSIKKEFVQYPEALELKALGFDEECLTYYFSDGTFNDAAEEDDTLYPGDPRFYSDTNSSLAQYAEGELKHDAVSAPTYSQAFRWFREKYKINSETPYLPNIEKYGIVASDMTIKPKDLSKNENFKRGSVVTNGYAQYSTHEEAELACLKKLIEIVKEK